MARTRSAGRRGCGWRGRLRGIAGGLALIAGVAPAAAQPSPDATGTFSIIARDPQTGELGLAVQSKAFAVGSRVITIKGGVAVVAHQAASNPMYGVIVLDMLAAGMTPQQALDVAVRADDGRDRRQVAVLDIQGRTAAWTGTGASEWKGHRCGVDYCAQGNILAGAAVVDALVSSFETSSGPLAERLVGGARRGGGGGGGGGRAGAASGRCVARPRNGAARRPPARSRTPPAPRGARPTPGAPDCVPRESPPARCPASSAATSRSASGPDEVSNDEASAPTTAAPARTLPRGR